MSDKNYRLLYFLVVVQIILGIVALNTDNFLFASGTAGVGAIITLLIFFLNRGRTKGHLYLTGAFLFSIAGDYFLTNMKGDSLMFVKGILLFFVAHIGYLLYAIVNGKIQWKTTIAVCTAYLLFFMLALWPNIEDLPLKIAALAYLFVSCFSFGAAMGLKKDDTGHRIWYVFGIALILLSDTIISFKEFLNYNHLDFLILPTYYLAHTVIGLALILKWNKKRIKNI